MAGGLVEALTVTRAAALSCAHTQKERPHSGDASPRIAPVLSASGYHRRASASLGSALPSTSARHNTESS